MKLSKHIWIAAGAMLAAAPALGEDEGEGTQKIGVLGGDFSDPAISVVRGESCAGMLKYLRGSKEKYRIVNASGVTGPPGVIYVLENPGGDIAVLKCGTACGHEGEEGEEET